MNGHTSNRIFRACLRSMKKEAERQIEQRGTSEYHQGKIDAIAEIDIFLDVGAFPE